MNLLLEKVGMVLSDGEFYELVQINKDESIDLIDENCDLFTISSERFTNITEQAKKRLTYGG